VSLRPETRSSPRWRKTSSPEFWFQPIADLRRGTVAGYEVLARFPVRSGLPPDLCFQQAAKLGRRLQLEDLCARSALESRPALFTNHFLTINVSPGYLLSECWQTLLRGAGDLAGVIFEITEEDSIADYATTRDRIEQIRTQGGMVAIDDAGAGYASLKHILELRPNFIKLDRMFIRNCHTIAPRPP
jgi:EAL domain-containing protein (putative c-di-GMP-specific phosphodiesterase class I)